jgi:flagellar capping protein FliD
MDSRAASSSLYAQELAYQTLFGTSIRQSRPANEVANDSVQKIIAHRNDSFSEETLRVALLEFEERTQKLYQAFHAFEFPEGELFNHYRTAFVSDPEAMTAQADLDAAEANYLIDIERLATSQTYQSKRLLRDDPTDLDEGTYTFTLTVGENSSTLSIGVDTSGLHPDTNKDVLQRIARMISAADDSLEVRVTETSRKVWSTLSDGLSEDVVYLTIRNKHTGNAPSISLEDSSGELVSNLRLDHLVEGGTPLQYRLNSIPSTSQTNQVALDDSRVNFTFLETTSTPIETVVQAGLEPLKAKIAELFSLYNDYTNWLDENRRYFKSSPKLGMEKVIGDLSNGLEDLGLTFDSHGQIWLQDEFDTAMVQRIDDVRQALTGEEGLIPEILTALEGIIRNGGDKYIIASSINSIDTLV